MVVDADQALSQLLESSDYGRCDVNSVDENGTRAEVEGDSEDDTPKGNPIQFGRRKGLEKVISILEDQAFEYTEVQQEILETRERKQRRGVGERVYTRRKMW